MREDVVLVRLSGELADVHIRATDLRSDLRDVTRARLERSGDLVDTMPEEVELEAAVAHVEDRIVLRIRYAEQRVIATEDTLEAEDLRHEADGIQLRMLRERPVAVDQFTAACHRKELHRLLALLDHGIVVEVLLGRLADVIMELERKVQLELLHGHARQVDDTHVDAARRQGEDDVPAVDAVALKGLLQKVRHRIPVLDHAVLHDIIRERLDENVLQLSLYDV